MSDMQVLIAILVMAAVTALIRFLPFLVFGKAKTPAFIEYLGKVLPCAVMGMLVVYCLKDVRFEGVANWVPSAVGVAVTAGVHAWKRNPIYSILAGTIVYMILIRIL